MKFFDFLLAEEVAGRRPASTPARGNRGRSSICTAGTARPRRFGLAWNRTPAAAEVAAVFASRRTAPARCRPKSPRPGAKPAKCSPRRPGWRRRSCWSAGSCSRPCRPRPERHIASRNPVPRRIRSANWPATLAPSAESRSMRIVTSWFKTNVPALRTRWMGCGTRAMASDSAAWASNPPKSTMKTARKNPDALRIATPPNGCGSPTNTI